MQDNNYRYFRSMKKILLAGLIFCCTQVAAQSTPQSLGIKLIKEIKCSPVRDQYMSSTCWSFASNSFIESEILLKNKEKVDLSEMYIARYSYLNKVNEYLAKKGEIYFTPGGQFHDVLIMEKFLRRKTR